MPNGNCPTSITPEHTPIAQQPVTQWICVATVGQLSHCPIPAVPPQSPTESRVRVAHKYAHIHDNKCIHMLCLSLFVFVFEWSECWPIGRPVVANYGPVHLTDVD